MKATKQKSSKKIMKHFGNRTKFWRPSSHKELVYLTDILSGQAVEAAFESAASYEKRFEELYYEAVISLNLTGHQIIYYFHQQHHGYYQKIDNLLICCKIFSRLQCLGNHAKICQKSLNDLFRHVRKTYVMQQQMDNG